MSKLLWFHGINWNTPVNEIGWMWLLLIGLSVVLVTATVQLIKEFTR